MPPEVRQEMNDIAREVGLEGEVDEVRTIAVEAVPISMEGELLLLAQRRPVGQGDCVHGDGADRDPRRRGP